MRATAVWLIGLLAAGVFLSPGGVYGQEVPPADPVFPFPIYHDRPETGGLYMTGEYVMYRQTNPLQHQPIAVRGFFDVDGTITGRTGGHVGSFTPVLFADDAGGPGTYQPGFRVGIGWRFRDGLSFEVSWMNLFKAQYFAVRTLVPPGFQSGPFQADSFLSAPVFNFPAEYSGPPIKEVALATFPTFHNLNAGYGIWNAADLMSISFVQRFEQIDGIGRVPIFETDCDRCYGLVGFRFSWIWEQFKWRTVDSGFNAGSTNINPQVIIDPFTGQITDPETNITVTLSPDQSPLNAAIYTNTVSNRMYGPVVGFGNECYIGHGFSVSLDILAGLYLDVVKEIAKYELGERDQAPQIKRAITQYRMAEEVQASLSLWWYPIEGVQVQFGYDIMGFFNTIASKEPVSFNYGGVDPAWTEFFRFFDGLHVGIGITF